MVETGISVTSYEIGPSTWGDQGETALLHTSQGDITCLFRQAPGSEAAVLWTGSLFGESQNRRTSPISQAVAKDLAKDGIASLLLRYRHTHDLAPCIRDTQAAISFLEEQGFQRIALVGHSFSGAVVISVAPLSQALVAVVTLASQTYGARGAPHVSPHPLLLIHGTADQRLGPHCSEQIYSWARQPKELVLLEGASHGLWESREELLPLLHRWLADKLQAEPAKPEKTAR